MSDRAELLRRLVDFREPAEPILKELGSLGWDWDEDHLLVLVADHFMAVFSRFLDGEIDDGQLEEWAENLESRDDVGFDPQQEESLKDLLFGIATPENYEPLTADLIRGMQHELSADRGSSVQRRD